MAELQLVAVHYELRDGCGGFPTLAQRHLVRLSPAALIADLQKAVLEENHPLLPGRVPTMLRVYGPGSAAAAWSDASAAAAAATRIDSVARVEQSPHETLAVIVRPLHTLLGAPMQGQRRHRTACRWRSCGPGCLSPLPQNVSPSRCLSLCLCVCVCACAVCCLSLFSWAGWLRELTRGSVKASSGWSHCIETHEEMEKCNHSEATATTDSRGARMRAAAGGGGWKQTDTRGR